MRWCCKSSKHPWDWVCQNIVMRPACPQTTHQRVGRVGWSKALTHSQEDASAETPDQGEIEPLEFGLNWLDGFAEALDLAETEPSTSQLLVLAQTLQELGFFEDALDIGEYLERRSYHMLSALLIEIYRVQADAHEALKDPTAAEAVRKLAEELATARQPEARES